DAFDFSGIASYWLNDTTHFAIDGTGNISNVTGLLVGIYWVEIRAYDPYTHFAAATFKVTVQDTTAPTWDEVPSNQFLEFGLAFSYEVNASDYGGISSYWVNDTAHFTITVDGLLTNATGLTVGIYGVELRAYDPSNNYCTAIIQVIVQDTNDPTWDEPATDQQFELGDMFSYNLNASDPSGISQWWLNDTTHFAIDSTGLITNVGLVPVGIYALEVRAYDPYSRYCSMEFTITVEDTVMPTWDVTPTNPVIEFGDSFSYDLDASDLGGISTYWINDTSHFAIDSHGLISSIATLPVGTHNIEVRAYDPSNNYCQAFIQVTVEDTTAPTWDPTPTDQLLAPGESLDYQLSATDLSGIHQWTINDTTHFTISGTGRITSDDPLDSGVYSLLVTVADPYGNTRTATFTVTVLPPAPPGVPGFPIEAIILALIGTLGLGVLIRRQRRK
ncbi:MAG: cadherin repeat domain-containing protein, partial [Promethearchaeota archaeon]